MKLQDIIYKEEQDFNRLLIDKDLNVSTATWFNRFVVWLTNRVRGKESRYNKLTVAQVIQNEFFDTKSPNSNAFENLKTLKNRFLKVKSKNSEEKDVSLAFSPGSNALEGEAFTIKAAFDEAIKKFDPNKNVKPNSPILSGRVRQDDETKIIQNLEDKLFSPREIANLEKEIDIIKKVYLQQQKRQIQELEKKFLEFISTYRRSELEVKANSTQIFKNGNRVIIKKEEIGRLEKSIEIKRRRMERQPEIYNQTIIQLNKEKFGEEIVNQVLAELSLDQQENRERIDSSKFAARYSEIQERKPIIEQNEIELNLYENYFSEDFIEARIKAFAPEGKNQIKLGLIKVPPFEEIVGKIIEALEEEYKLQMQRDAAPEDEDDKNPINSVWGYLLSIIDAIKYVYKDDFAKELIAEALRELGYPEIEAKDIQFEMRSLFDLLITKMSIHETNFQKVKDGFHEELIKLITAQKKESEQKRSQRSLREAMIVWFGDDLKEILLTDRY